jgi:drug/metabolite transporter (DMT)-like permease
MAAAVIPAMLLMQHQQESSDLRRKDTWLTGLALGMATVLYFTGILHSDVIRVIFLFYLLPLWTTLSARLIYGEPIRRTKLIVIATSLSGLWLLLGAGSSLPVPQNAGDWCGIGAGLCWGVSLSLLRGREETRPFAATLTTLVVALVLSSVLATIIFLWSDTRLPSSIALSAGHFWPTTLGLTGVFGALILFPAMLGQIWGARRIPAPTAALLTMTEIIVATLSAGLIIGSDLQPLSWLGGGIIVLAVCIDLMTQGTKR